MKQENLIEKHKTWCCKADWWLYDDGGTIVCENCNRDVTMEIFIINDALVNLN